jgi:hypothetical protein
MRPRPDFLIIGEVIESRDEGRIVATLVSNLPLSLRRWQEPSASENRPAQNRRNAHDVSKHNLNCYFDGYDNFSSLGRTSFVCGIDMPLRANAAIQFCDTAHTDPIHQPEVRRD